MKPRRGIILGCVENTEANGTIVEVIGEVPVGVRWRGPDGVLWIARGDCYFVESLGKKFFAEGAGKYSQFTLVRKTRVFPIDDAKGNESFVVEARKSLPRSKPATAKGDTIDARGEVA
ncbi:MAG: hypothetical protein Q7T46_11565 [Polaromonas sp.]|nr:hypothetical protein [Polaromonas sp.]